MKYKIFNERGFMLLNVVILTLIVSFAAMIVLNSVTKVHHHNSSLNLHAMYLANEMMAVIESQAAKGELATKFPSNWEDDKFFYEDYSRKNNSSYKLVELKVSATLTNVGENLYRAKVTVREVGEDTEICTAEKTVLFYPVEVENSVEDENSDGD